MTESKVLKFIEDHSFAVAGVVWILTLVTIMLVVDFFGFAFSVLGAASVPLLYHYVTPKIDTRKLWAVGQVILTVAAFGWFGLMAYGSIFRLTSPPYRGYVSAAILGVAVGIFTHSGSNEDGSRFLQFAHINLIGRRQAKSP